MIHSVTKCIHKYIYTSEGSVLRLIIDDIISGSFG